MPEEPIHSIDIPQDGTAGAAFLGTARMQKLEKANEEALGACARIIELKNDEITTLVAERSRLVSEVTTLEDKVRTLHDIALNEEQPGPLEKWLP
jgi:hypothetical protein